MSEYVEPFKLRNKTHHGNIRDVEIFGNREERVGFMRKKFLNRVSI